MDKALVFGTKDCRFESCQGHTVRAGQGFRSGDCSVNHSGTQIGARSETHSSGRRWCQAIGPVWGNNALDIPSANAQLWVVASWPETQAHGEAAPTENPALLKNHKCHGPPGWCGRFLDTPAPGLGGDTWSQTAGRHLRSGLGVVREVHTSFASSCRGSRCTGLWVRFRGPPSQVLL